jgi:hypothetical protein
MAGTVLASAQNLNVRVTFGLRCGIVAGPINQQVSATMQFKKPLTQTLAPPDWARQMKLTAADPCSRAVQLATDQASSSPRRTGRVG